MKMIKMNNLWPKKGKYLFERNQKRKLNPK